MAPDLCAGQAREDRGFEPLDPHRHHHRPGFLGDQCGTVIDLHQAAGDRDAPFREDHQGVAVPDRLNERAGRERLGRIERHRPRHPDERPHPPALGELAINREDRLLAQDREGDCAVEKADVVEGDDRIAARLVEVFQPPDLEPVEGAQQDRQEVLEGAGRHGPGDPHCSDKTDRGDAEEQYRDPDPDLLQQRDDERTANHECGIEHIDGGDDAGASLGCGPGLDRRKGRHDHQPARHREQAEVDRDVPGDRPGKKGGGHQGAPSCQAPAAAATPARDRARRARSAMPRLRSAAARRAPPRARRRDPSRRRWRRQRRLDKSSRRFRRRRACA